MTDDDGGFGPLNNFWDDFDKAVEDFNDAWNAFDREDWQTQDWRDVAQSFDDMTAVFEVADDIVSAVDWDYEREIQDSPYQRLSLESQQYDPDWARSRPFSDIGQAYSYGVEIGLPEWTVFYDFDEDLYYVEYKTRTG